MPKALETENLSPVGSLSQGGMLEGSRYIV